MASIGHTRAYVATIPALLAALAVAAPLFGRDHALAALSLTQFFSLVCHQDPSRSFWIAGAPVAVCVRCLGIHLGAATGAWIRIGHRSALRFVGIAAAINLLDVITEIVGLHPNWPDLRLALGTVFGVSLGALVVNAAGVARACPAWPEGARVARPLHTEPSTATGASRVAR